MNQYQDYCNSRKVQFSSGTPATIRFSCRTFTIGTHPSFLMYLQTYRQYRIDDMTRSRLLFICVSPCPPKTRHATRELKFGPSQTTELLLIHCVKIYHSEMKCSRKRQEQARVLKIANVVKITRFLHVTSIHKHLPTLVSFEVKFVFVSFSNIGTLVESSETSASLAVARTSSRSIGDVDLKPLWHNWRLQDQLRRRKN